MVISLVAVLGAAVLNMVIGFIWYGPLFGKQWMKLMGITKKQMKDMQKGATKAYALNFVSMLISAYVLAMFIGITQAATMVDGAITAFWLWLGFTVTVKFSNVLWANTPVKLFLLDSGYWLVSTLGMGAAIVALS